MSLAVGAAPHATPPTPAAAAPPASTPPASLPVPLEEHDELAPLRVREEVDGEGARRRERRAAVAARSGPAEGDCVVDEGWRVA